MDPLKRQMDALKKHYGYVLAVMFGAAIAGHPELWEAWDINLEEMDTQFDDWVEEFLESDEDDSYVFFEGKIKDWVKEQSSQDASDQASAVLTAGSVKPGDTVYAVVQEKKLNSLGRWITTKNFAVKSILVMSITIEPDALEATLNGYEESADGPVSYTEKVKNCYMSVEAANNALKAVK